MNIVIIGCGRSGLRLANALSEHDFDVAVVDKSQTNLDLLGNDFEGITVCGSPIDRDVLTDAGCASADFVAIVTRDDNTNIMCAQVLRRYFDIKNVVTRILDPAREDAYRRLGLKTICPTRFVADTLFGECVMESSQIYSLGLGARFANFEMLPVGRRMVGKPFFSTETGENEMLYGVRRRGGEIVLANAPGAVFREGDEMIVTRIME